MTFLHGSDTRRIRAISNLERPDPRIKVQPTAAPTRRWAYFLETELGVYYISVDKQSVYYFQICHCFRHSCTVLSPLTPLREAPCLITNDSLH